MSKPPPPHFGVENHACSGFFSILSQKSVSESRLHGVCKGRNGTNARVLYAHFSFMLAVSATSVTPCYPL